MITMRTKHVLMAMALPALFAACTSDEFVEQPTQGSLDGREVLGNLTVNVAGDADTRFDWSTAGWTFEDGDQFGAAVTDPTSLGTVENDKMLGNYIFSKNGNGYQTTSQMVEGTYLFYSYNQPESFVTKNTRDLIAFDLTTQTADLNDPEKAVSDNQLFISPLYFIEAENTTAENTIALPLRFIPYYSTAAFRIKNSTGAAFSISQIVLNGKFKAKGEIDPSKIWNQTDNGYGLYYSVPEGGDAYELIALNPQGKLTETEVEEKYKGAYETADLATGATQTVSSLVLNCDNYVLANGKEVVAYMQVPVSEQTDMTASIIVRVNGVSKQINVTETAENGKETGKKSIASTGINKAKFTRTATKAVFGLESDGSLKVLDVKAVNLDDAGGFYVDNNEELLDVLDNERGDINFYNTGDVELNDEVIKVLNTYTAGAVTFSNPIKINVKSEETLTLSSTVGAGVTFKGDVTVDGNVGLGNNVTLEKDMTVEAGKVVLSGANVDDKEITVKGGELELAATVKANKISVKAGTLRVTSSQTQTATDIPALDFTPADSETTNSLIVGTKQKAVTFNLATATTFSENTTVEVDKGSEIITYSTLKNEGTVVNNGKIGLGGSGTFSNEGTISNYGTLTGITNNGLIKMMDVWDSALTLNSTAGNGYIDNTINLALSGTTGNTVYSYYTGTISSIATSNVDIVVLNSVTVGDKVTLANSEDVNFLLLGNNTFGTYGGEGVTLNTTGNMQIGLKDETDENLALAKYAAGLSFTAQYTPAMYSQGMTTTFNSGTISVGDLECYGGSNRNQATFEYTTTTSLGTWQGTTPTQE